MSRNYASLSAIRRKVFCEVAKLAYEGNDYQRIEQLPYKIIPGEIATYRDSVFLERAIVGERLRLAMGLSLRSIDTPAPISEGIQDSIIAEKYYEPPLINIIKFACNSCAKKVYRVSDGCQACLGHPCIDSCAKKAISFVDGKSYIDEDKCIKCGRCKDVCPYDAIQKIERPCSAACGMGAIDSDQYGRATIDYNKCVSCGMCLVSCPFGAIADKSQIFQLIQSINRGDTVIAAVAPAFIGQFGPSATSSKLKKAMELLGFHDVVEVAIGADLCTIEEANEFLERVPAKQPFMGTSCCPAWSVMAKTDFPEFKSYISMSLTPMVLTARLIKKETPNVKVVFIGPCAAKKLEASRKSVRSEVDFVLTFEELRGLFDAKDIHFETMEIENKQEIFKEASADGRGFAIGGGVASAVVNCIKQQDPETKVMTQAAQGLKACRQMLQIAKTGKYNGYLLEGMACPGGCVSGAGTLQPMIKSTALVTKYKTSTVHKTANTSEYKEQLDALINDYK